MITRLDASPVKSRRLRSLESAWNDTINISNQPRRHAQMTKDIRKFVLQSIDGDIHQAERTAVAKPTLTASGTDIFGKISSTFNFTHHEGTDPKAEMKVVKIILIREGQIMTLQHLSDNTRALPPMHKSMWLRLQVTERGRLAPASIFATKRGAFNTFPAHVHGYWKCWQRSERAP
jgi:hypothetical protein